VDIQRTVRGLSARRRCDEEFLRLALREACARTEFRSALRIQRLWQQVQQEREAVQLTREERAARAIQNAHRSRQVAISPKRHQAQWLMVAEARVDEQSQQEASMSPPQSPQSSVRVLEASPTAVRSAGAGVSIAADAATDAKPTAAVETPAASSASKPTVTRSFSNSSISRQVIGVVEKETGFRTLGSWQLVTWNRRFLYTTPGALCYRHVTRGSLMPRGKTTAIAFSAVRRVGVHADEPTVLLLECELRQYFFRFPSAAQCERWTAIITVAATQCTDSSKRAVRAPRHHMPSMSHADTE